MTRFEIKEEFLLDGQPFKILSGAIHYFRVHPTNWERSLHNLKALGFNTVETYVPWNGHEPKKGEFTFEGIYDIAKFIKIAQELGLWVIVRPSPYICAEWEFGGLPAWLLKDENMRIRCNYEPFLQHIDDYFKVFFKDNIINLKHIFIFLILSILNLNFKFSPIKLILISGFLGVLLLN